MFYEKTLKLLAPPINKQLLTCNKIYSDNSTTQAEMYAPASGLDTEVPSGWQRLLMTSNLTI
jgi:hypothetical protein